MSVKRGVKWLTCTTDFENLYSVLQMANPKSFL